MDCMDYNYAYTDNLFHLADATPIHFVDPTNLDFHLQSSSPALSAGISLANNPIELDYNGESRDDPPNQGAYASWPTLPLLNPGRGFYHHTESHASSPAPLNLSSLQSVRAGGRTVLLRVYYLDTFLDTDTLTTTFLDQLATDFQTMLVRISLVVA